MKGLQLNRKRTETISHKKSNPTLEIWQEKLAYLQREAAIASNPAIKFELQK